MLSEYSIKKCPDCAEEAIGYSEISEIFGTCWISSRDKEMANTYCRECKQKRDRDYRSRKRESRSRKIENRSIPKVKIPLSDYPQLGRRTGHKHVPKNKRPVHVFGSKDLPVYNYNKLTSSREYDESLDASNNNARENEVISKELLNIFKTNDLIEIVDKENSRHYNNLLSEIRANRTLLGYILVLLLFISVFIIFIFMVVI